MATTCKLIAKQTLSGNAATVTFSDIPQTYTDLILVASARIDISDYGSWATFNPNGDKANVSGRSLYFGGTSALSTSYSSGNVGYFWISAALQTANCFSNTELYMPNYAGSTNKSWSVTAIGETNNATQALMGVAAFVWNSTAALTSFTLDPQGTGNFISGSSFYLYGITRVDDNSPGRFGIQATGGQEVYESGGYRYHVFKSSGTFTVTAPGWAEVLVVGGGASGGRGNAGGGGGGAGGLILQNTLIKPDGYSVLVGGGGAALTSTTGDGISGTNSFVRSLTSLGGGGGSGGSQGISGGSGGGGSSASTNGRIPGLGTVGQGNDGGAGFDNGQQRPGGGGGGAGSAGTAATSSSAGNGGTGSSVFGTTYAAGGGGGSGYEVSGSVPVAGAGGSSIGGNGGAATNPPGNATAGTVNTGSGGGGAAYRYAGQYGTSGAGGSGIVIIRYPI